MLPPVKIDLSGLGQWFDVSNDEVHDFAQDLVKRLAMRFVYDLRTQANNKLGKTRQEYIESINVNEIAYNTVMVELIGFLPNAVEQGLNPFDMKNGFSASEKVKHTKSGGWYITIPYTHSWGGAIGESSTFSGDPMPMGVWEQAKTLGGGESLANSMIPDAFRAVGSRKPVSVGSKMFDEYLHKSNKFEGMRRSNKESHSSYVTFRRVSNNSDPGSWIHTGIIARDLFTHAFDKEAILHEVDMARDEFFNNLNL